MMAHSVPFRVLVYNRPAEWRAHPICSLVYQVCQCACAKFAAETKPVLLENTPLGKQANWLG